ncbi:MAG TPA: hypothetical protein VI895_13515 [Bdellovibrionota bacterium]|nr:hypothetical protein [Bdellovibrionota bacterium]
MKEQWICSGCGHKFKPNPWQADVQCPRCGSLVDEPPPPDESETPTNVRPKRDIPRPPPKEPPIPNEIRELDELSAYDSVRPVLSKMPSLGSKTEIAPEGQFDKSPHPSEKTTVDLGEPEPREEGTAVRPPDAQAAGAQTPLPVQEGSPRTEFVLPPSPVQTLAHAFGPTLIACALFLAWVVYDKVFRHTPPPTQPTPEAPVMQTNDVEPLLLEAIRAIEDGNTDGARRLLDEAIHKNPQSALARELKDWLTPSSEPESAPSSPAPEESPLPDSDSSAPEE